MVICSVPRLVGGEGHIEIQFGLGLGLGLGRLVGGEGHIEILVAHQHRGALVEKVPAKKEKKPRQRELACKSTKERQATYLRGMARI